MCVYIYIFIYIYIYICAVHIQYLSKQVGLNGTTSPFYIAVWAFAIVLLIGIMVEPEQHGTLSRSRHIKLHQHILSYLHILKQQNLSSQLIFFALDVDDDESIESRHDVLKNPWVNIDDGSKWKIPVRSSHFLQLKCHLFIRYIYNITYITYIYYIYCIYLYTYVK